MKKLIIKNTGGGRDEENLLLFEVADVELICHVNMGDGVKNYSLMYKSVKY
jgi:hypothetical protein